MPACFAYQGSAATLVIPLGHAWNQEDELARQSDYRVR